MDTKIFFGGALKALGDNRIGGYLVRFTDESKRDLHGDYFTAQTDFHLSDYPLENRPILFNHGLYKGTGIKPIGRIISHKVDEIGLWVEGILDEHNQYTQAVKELMANGVLGWSSGALPQSVEVEDGFIKSWAIIEGSATHTPAMPIETKITTIKALSESPQGESDALMSASNISSDNTKQEGTDMTPDEIRALVISILGEMGLGAEAPEMPDMESAMLAETEKMGNKPDEELMKAVVSAGVKAYHDAHTRRQSLIKSVIADNAVGTSKVDTAMKSGAPSYVADYETKRKLGQASPEGLAFIMGVLSENQTRHSLTPKMKTLATQIIANDIVAKVNKGATDFTPEAVKSAFAINSMKSNELDNTGNTGFGPEWVWENWQSQLWERARSTNRVFANTPTFEMRADVDYYPLESTDPSVYFVAESTDATDIYSGNGTMSKIGTAKATFNSKKFMLQTGWSAEEDEDSIIRYADNASRQARRAFEDNIDYVILNGDTETGANTNINLIDGTPTTGVPYLAINGILKYPLVTNTANGIDFSTKTNLTEAISSARGLLNREFMNDVDRMVIYCDPETYNLMTRQAEFLTLEVAGAGYALRTGQVGWYLGIPVISTPRMAKANTAGKISATPGNNTKGRLAIVYTPYIMVGFRRRMTSYLARALDGEAYQLTLTARMDMQYHSDADHVACVYNITV